MEPEKLVFLTANVSRIWNSGYDIDDNFYNGYLYLTDNDAVYFYDFNSEDVTPKPQLVYNIVIPGPNQYGACAGNERSTCEYYITPKIDISKFDI